MSGGRAGEYGTAGGLADGPRCGGISAVIPTLDEERCIGALVLAVRSLVDEVIVCDGGSTDETVLRAADAGARVVTGARGRGAQLDLGARTAVHERLWFLHADSRVHPHAGEALRAATGPWGCFATRIDSADPRLRFTAAGMTLRARWTGVCSGDMGLWADRRYFEALGGFGNTAFEDLAFADRARRQDPCEVLDPLLLTSARRWQSEGVTNTVLRFWMIRLGYRVGVEPGRLAGVYRSRPR